MPMILGDSLRSKSQILLPIICLIFVSVVGPVVVSPGGLNIVSDSRSTSSSFASCLLFSFCVLSLISDFFSKILELIFFPQQVDEILVKNSEFLIVEVV